MKKGNLANIKSGTFCKHRNGDEEFTFALSDNDELMKTEENGYGFCTTIDSDGWKHFGIWLSDDEIEQRVEHIREFYNEGMIPWVCPSCGKLWGGQYDVGSLLWFKCHVCGAEWKQTNTDEVEKIIDAAKKGMS